jgi:hypothetical protein
MPFSRCSETYNLKTQLIVALFHNRLSARPVSRLGLAPPLVFSRLRVKVRCC